MRAFPKQWQEPWAITGEGGARLLEAWSARDFLPVAQAARREMAIAGGEPLRKDGRARVIGGVAVIPVYGALFRHADWMESMCGGRSYESLLADIDAALQSPSVARILLDFDTPGGEANGCFEASERIAAADLVKPIEAYVGGYAASAGWSLACGAQRITAHASSFVGCIGVRLVLVDTSAADAALGLKYVELVSKRAPDKRGLEIDEALIARLQGRIDGLEDEFISWVAAQRGVSAKVVAEDFGRGDVIMGRQAIDVKMVDELGAFDEVLARLQGEAANSWRSATNAGAARREVNMLKTGNPAANMADESCDGCGRQMAGGDECYCSACYTSAEEEAKALGVGEKASAADRRKRIDALVSLEKAVLEATGAETPAAATGKLTAMADSHRELAAVKDELGKLQAEGVRRDLRAVLESGIASKRLSPGRIMKSAALVLRGETRSAWDKAMAGVEKKEVTAESVIAAACSVAVSADDVAAISEFAKAADPVSASTFREPPRDPNAESGELDAMAAQVEKIAADIRKKEEARAQQAAQK